MITYNTKPCRETGFLECVATEIRTPNQLIMSTQFVVNELSASAEINMH